MSKFEKKLKNLLDSATENGVIDHKSAQGLFSYAKSDEYEHKGWMNLSSAMGGIGALVICFGIILIVAKNWYNISDITKLSGFLALLGGTHFLALFITDKGYGKTAQAIHFLGAGLVLAGIGLIGQIFQLYSDQGKAFFSWFVMILPLAFLLRSGPILLMSVVAFLLWGNSFIDGNLYFSGTDSHLFTFNASMCIFGVTAGLLLKSKNNPMCQFLQVPAMIILVIGLYIAGFSHNFGYMRFPDKLNLISAVIILASIATCAYLYVKAQNDRFDKYFILSVGASIIPVIVVCFVFLFDFDKGSYFKHFSFGWTKKIYYVPLIISVFSWIAYFALAFWGVIYGSLNHHRWMLNCNIILIGLGVFTRFLDLVGDMLDAGILFVVCGLFLFAIGFGLEKWRRRLIANAQVRGVANG